MRVHHENHCHEFNMFADNILNQSVVIDILESICEARDHPSTGVYFRAKQTLDREGANREIVGYVVNGEREFSFRCIDGNWNGTEIVEFEETEPGDGCIHSLTYNNWYD